MILYNKKSLKNLSILKQAKVWREKKVLTESAFQQILETYSSDFYTPNFFIRTGLFLFSCILIAASLGFITLISASGGLLDNGLLVRLLIYALLTAGATEVITKEKKLYRAGVDDALQYTTVGLTIAFISLFIDVINRSDSDYYYENDHHIQILAFSLPILLIFAIRYVDRLLTALSFGVLIYLIFYLVSNTGTIGQAICPFVIGLTSFLIYWFVRSYAYNEKSIIWKDSFKVVEFLSLLTLYLSLNYFVVRELNAVLQNDPSSPQIPFAWLFYCTTAVIPLLYLYFGVTNKDRLLLQLGMFLVTFSVFTFKYYFSLSHHELTITLAGILMIVVAWYVNNLLKTPKLGLTANKDDLENALNGSDAEALVIVETMGKNNAQEDAFKFGEGEFGGGGAGGKF
jgi:uncharacterized membrane protein YgcG